MSKLTKMALCAWHAELLIAARSIRRRCALWGIDNSSSMLWSRGRQHKMLCQGALS